MIHPKKISQTLKPPVQATVRRASTLVTVSTVGEAPAGTNCFQPGPGEVSAFFEKNGRCCCLICENCGWTVIFFLWRYTFLRNKHLPKMSGVQLSLESSGEKCERENSTAHDSLHSDTCRGIAICIATLTLWSSSSGLRFALPSRLFSHGNGKFVCGCCSLIFP